MDEVSSLGQDTQDPGTWFEGRDPNDYPPPPPRVTPVSTAVSQLLVGGETAAEVDDPTVTEGLGLVMEVSGGTPGRW